MIGKSSEPNSRPWCVTVAGAASDKPLPVGGGEVVAIALEVALPTGATASLAVCLPAKSLLPADVDPVPAQPTSSTARALGDVTVEVSLRLPATTVSAVEVEDLHPGDVIRLEAEALSALVGVLTGQGEDVLRPREIEHGRPVEEASA